MTDLASDSPTLPTVTRSLDRILKIGGKRYRLYAEDWLSDYQAEEAASLCTVAVNYSTSESDDITTFDVTVPVLESMLGVLARAKLGVDDTRPYGFCIVVEPLQ